MVRSDQHGLMQLMYLIELSRACYYRQLNVRYERKLHKQRQDITRLQASLARYKQALRDVGIDPREVRLANRLDKE